MPNRPDHDERGDGRRTPNPLGRHDANENQQRRTNDQGEIRCWIQDPDRPILLCRFVRTRPGVGFKVGGLSQGPLLYQRDKKTGSRDSFGLAVVPRSASTLFDIPLLSNTTGLVNDSRSHSRFWAFSLGMDRSIPSTDAFGLPDRENLRGGPGAFESLSRSKLMGLDRVVKCPIRPIRFPEWAISPAQEPVVS